MVVRGSPASVLQGFHAKVVEVDDAIGLGPQTNPARDTSWQFMLQIRLAVDPGEQLRGCGFL